MIFNLRRLAKHEYFSRIIGIILSMKRVEKIDIFSTSYRREKVKSQLGLVVKLFY